jgi:hypothetical protein
MIMGGVNCLQKQLILRHHLLLRHHCLGMLLHALQAKVVRGTKENQKRENETIDSLKRRILIMKILNLSPC